MHSRTLHKRPSDIYSVLRVHRYRLHMYELLKKKRLNTIINPLDFCFVCKFRSVINEYIVEPKDWMVWSQDNVSQWRDMSTLGLLFQ
jgi:hypothetical protein